MAAKTTIFNPYDETGKGIITGIEFFKTGGMPPKPNDHTIALNFSASTRGPLYADLDVSSERNSATMAFAFDENELRKANYTTHGVVKTSNTFLDHSQDNISVVPTVYALTQALSLSLSVVGPDGGSNIFKIDYNGKNANSILEMAAENFGVDSPLGVVVTSKAQSGIGSGPLVTYTFDQSRLNTMAIVGPDGSKSSFGLNTNAIRNINFFNGPGIGTIVSPSVSGPSIRIGIDPPTAKTALGLGTSAYVNTGVAQGDVPILGVNGKLAESTIPAIALVNVYTIPTADTVADLVAYVNNASTSPAAQQGDVLIVNGGTLISQVFILTVTKAVGAYTAADLTAIKVPGGAVNSINYLGTAYTPLNGTVTLPATVPYAKVAGVPTATATVAGITKLYSAATPITAAADQAASMTTVKAVYDIALTMVGNVTPDDGTIEIKTYDLPNGSKDKGIKVKRNTSFATGVLITDDSSYNMVNDGSVNNFINKRVYNEEVTFTSAQVTATTPTGAGTYKYTFALPTGCTRLDSPRVLQVILSNGKNVLVPITYNKADKSATIDFYDPLTVVLSTAYDGVFNTPANIHTLVLSSMVTQ